MIPFNKPHFTGKETHYIEEAVKSGKISGNGIFTQKCQTFFEELKIDREASKILKIKYIISTIPLTNSYLELSAKIPSKYWDKIYIYKITQND